MEEIDMSSLDWGCLCGHEGILKAGGQQSPHHCMASRCGSPVDPWRWSRGQAGTGSAVERPGHCYRQGPVKVPDGDAGESWITHHCTGELGSVGPSSRPGEPTSDHLPRGTAKSFNGSLPFPCSI